jgi:hypothetical protein
VIPGEAIIAKVASKLRIGQVIWGSRKAVKVSNTVKGNGLKKLKIINGRVGGKIPIDDYNAILKTSIKNPNANSMTFGRYTKDSNSYTIKAGKDSSFFDLGDDWNIIKKKYDLTDKEMFEFFNVPAIDNAISNGKTIRFSHNPLNYKTGALPQEWEYIKSVLGKTDADLFLEGGFWNIK